MILKFVSHLTLPIALYRKIKAGVCPYPDSALSQSITFGADPDIAYSPVSTLRGGVHSSAQRLAIDQARVADRQRPVRV